MKVLAVSGGVDSMLLAFKYKDKKDIVIAFVNYNVREDTHIDEKIVNKFAKKHNIKIEKLILDGSSPKKNFENWARQIRYDFFKKIYKKYNCNQLVIAHHKDDFLETCIMQEEKNKNKLFYGIKKQTYLNGMKIYRPFLNKYWKDEIYELAYKNKIDFNDDSTNFDNKYKRNYVRNKVVSKLSKQEKQKKLDYYLTLNKSNQKIINQIKYEYSLWSKSKFDTKKFDEFENKEDLIKLYINKRSSETNLNKRIIENIILFIKTRNNKKSFILNNQNMIYKNNNKIYFKKKW